MSDISLVLSCFGREDDDFISCSGCKNRLLIINESHYHYNEIMDYFDSMQLFDKPQLNTNAIRHIIFNMQDRFDMPGHKLWSEKMFKLYQKFVIDHKDCGLRLQLDIVNE